MGTMFHAHLGVDKLLRHFTSMFSYWTLLHYKHPGINKRRLQLPCVCPAPLTLSMGPALHLPESRQEMQRWSWRALQHKWLLLNTTLSGFPEYLNALQNSTGVVTLLVPSSCSILESLVLCCRVLLLFPRTCLPTKGIYEQQSCINHLPSSADYIQAFLFLKCHFLVPIHSFSKCTQSFFVSVPLPPRNKRTLFQNQCIVWRVYSWGNILFLL